jgi:hypothetical protein
MGGAPAAPFFICWYDAALTPGSDCGQHRACNNSRRRDENDTGGGEMLRVEPVPG